MYFDCVVVTALLALCVPLYRSSTTCSDAGHAVMLDLPTADTCAASRTISTCTTLITSLSRRTDRGMLCRRATSLQMRHAYLLCVVSWAVACSPGRPSHRRMYHQQNCRPWSRELAWKITASLQAHQSHVALTHLARHVPALRLLCVPLKTRHTAT